MNAFLKNLKSNNEMEFQIEPSSLVIRKSFRIGSQNYLQSREFHISYQGSSPQIVSAFLHLDDDQDRNVNFQKFFSFIDELGDIDTQANLPPQVCLRMGKHQYQGFIADYQIVPLRMRGNNLAAIQMQIQLHVL
jgi:hypothetical protein